MNQNLSKTKQKIISCAVNLLQKKGVKGLGQIQVAKKAKISQGNLTYHFPKKSDLILEIAEQALKPILLLLSESQNKKRKLTKKNLVNLLINVLNNTERTRSLLGLLVESENQKNLTKKILKSLENERFLIELLVPSKNKTNSSILIQSTLIGLAIQNYIHIQNNKDYRLNELLEELFKWTKNIDLQVG